MNINENKKNLEKIQGCMYIITYISPAFVLYNQTYTKLMLCHNTFKLLTDIYQQNKLYLSC